MKPANLKYNPAHSKMLPDVPYRKQQRIKNTAYEITQVEDFLKNQMGEEWRQWAIRFEKNYHRKVDATDLTGGILVRFREYQRIKATPALHEAAKWNSIDDFVVENSSTSRQPGSPTMRTLRANSPLSKTVASSTFGSTGSPKRAASPAGLASTANMGRPSSPGHLGDTTTSVRMMLAKNRSNEFDINTIVTKFQEKDRLGISSSGGPNPASPLSPKLPQKSIPRARSAMRNGSSASQGTGSPITICSSLQKPVSPKRTANDRVAYQPVQTKVARASLDNTGWPIPSVGEKWLETKHPPPNEF